MTRPTGAVTTCATCSAPAVGIVSFIAADHSHSDWDSCIACATDALLNSLARVTWTMYSSGASVARGVSGAA